MAGIFNKDFFGLKNLFGGNKFLSGKDFSGTPVESPDSQTTASPSGKPKTEKYDWSEMRKAIKNLRTGSGDKKSRYRYDNPVLEKYYENINKQEDKLQKGKMVETDNLMSDRYHWKGDIGVPSDEAGGVNAKTSGWTGLFTKKQMQEAGIDLNDKDIDTSMIASTAIAGIRYNPETGNLYVKFRGGKGKEYLFPNVPEETVRRMLNAESKGRFYGKKIKPYAVSAAEAQAIAAKYKGK